MKNRKTNKKSEKNSAPLFEKQEKEIAVMISINNEEIISEKTFSDKLIDSLFDILVVLDNNMDVIKTNAEFTKNLGYKIDVNKRLSLYQLVPQNRFEEIKQLIQSGEFKNYETELIAKNGRRFLACINGSVISNEKKGKKMHLLLAKDKTEVYEMMSRVRESQRQLIHSGRLASLGEMAAGIAHELTQPLNAILLFARNSLKSLSHNKIKNDLIEENLTFIIDRVKKANSIIKSLKSFARKTEDEKIFIDINSIIKNVLKFLEAQLELSDVKVELYIADNIPLVMANNVRIEQVFLNIIQNALQAMSKVDNPKLIISTAQEEHFDPDNLKNQTYVVTSIRDNGVGMTEDVKARIFDPFFTTREVGSGMGLGLSIVDRIIRDHSGHIKVTSNPGHSSCFSIFLPSTGMRQ